jgi:hypothetical protein
MLLCGLAGRRAAALTQYKRCRVLLQKELGIEPSKETEDLRQRIANGSIRAPRESPKAASQPNRAARNDFVGREAELATITRAIDGASLGAGRLVVLVGEAGIGKTRLLEEAAAYAAGRGRRVLWGRSHDDMGLPPYWPWRQLLEELIAQSTPEKVRQWAGKRGALLGRLVDNPGKVFGESGQPQVDSPESARFLLSEAVGRFLREAARDRPLMVVLDDLHWADEASLNLLEFVARELAETPLVVLGACRDAEPQRSQGVAGLLGALGRNKGYERLELRSLVRVEVARLMEVSRGAPSPAARVDVLWEKTRGNPLFVVEYLRSLPGANGDTRDTGTIPANVSGIITHRLKSLSSGCRTMLEASAAFGTDFDAELLGRIAGFSARELLHLLSEAGEAKIIAEIPDAAGSYRFSHPLVREALAAQPSASRKAELHATIADVLEGHYGQDSESHAVELAHHLGLAKLLTPREKLARYCFLAGEQALASYAPEAARRHFLAGLEAKGPGANDAQTAWLRFGLARTIFPPASSPFAMDVEPGSGAYAAASAAYAFFLQAGDVGSALKVAAWPLFVWFEHTDEIQALCERAVGLAASGSAEDTRIRWLAGWMDYIRSGDYPAACRVFEQTLAAARAGGDPLLELHVLSAWLSAAVYRGPIADAAAMVRRSRELLRRVDDPIAEMAFQFRAYHVALGLADLTTAAERVQSISALAMRLKVPHEMLMACLVKMEFSWLRGDCGAALAASDEAFAVNADAPVYREHVCRRARMEFELGNAEAGQSFLARYLDALRQIGVAKNADSAIACALLPQIASITGDRNLLDIARDAAEEWVPEGKEREACKKFGWAQIVVPGLGFTAALQGDKNAARRLRRALIATRGSSPPWGGSTDRLLARLDMTLGEAHEAVAHLEQAVSDCRPLGRINPDLAWMNYEYAQALQARGEAGDRALAGEALREALQVARTLGLKPLEKGIRSLKGGSL